MPEDPVIPQIKVENRPVAAPPPVAPVVVARKPRKALWITLGIFAVLFIYSLISGLIVYKKALVLKNSVLVLKAAAESKDLPKIKEGLARTQASLKSLKSGYSLIAWGRIVPFLGGYVADGKHVLNAGTYSLETVDILLTTIEPYADLLGLADGKPEAAKIGRAHV